VTTPYQGVTNLFSGYGNVNYRCNSNVPVS